MYINTHLCILNIIYLCIINIKINLIFIFPYYMLTMKMVSYSNLSENLFNKILYSLEK